MAICSLSGHIESCESSLQCHSVEGHSCRLNKIDTYIDEVQQAQSLSVGVLDEVRLARLDGVHRRQAQVQHVVHHFGTGEGFYLRAVQCAGGNL